MHWVVPLSSDHHYPSPVAMLAYHANLPERGTILAQTFADFLFNVLKNDLFQMLACEKPIDHDEEDGLSQMSTRYWAFFLLQIARLDTMVSLTSYL